MPDGGAPRSETARRAAAAVESQAIRGFGQVLTQPALALASACGWEYTTLIASGDDSTDSSVCWMRATDSV